VGLLQDLEADAKFQTAKAIEGEIMHRFKLGVKAFKTDSRSLKLERYLSPKLPAPPASCDWSKGITEFGMMLNGPDSNNPPGSPDGLGDCTIAGVAHAIQVLTANASSEITVPDSTVLKYYESWDGYVLGNPNTDNGGVELDVLNDWRKQTFAGHELLAYVDANPHNLISVKRGISLFGGAYIGLTVTNQVMNNSGNPEIPWDTTGDTSIAGGHCVFVLKYDPEFIYFISWGQIYKMTRKYWYANVQEVHILLSQDFISANGLSPNHFNLAQLQADLAAIN
jgi:hypothetical protein